MENNELELKKKAALKGDNEACLFVALWYANNAHRDDYEAHKWFGLGAKRGHVLCQFYYGNDFDVGEGCEVDPFQALHWYKMAADQGHEYAKMMVEWTITKIHTGSYERRTKMDRMTLINEIKNLIKRIDAINAEAIDFLLNGRPNRDKDDIFHSLNYINEFVENLEDISEILDPINYGIVMAIPDPYLNSLRDELEYKYEQMYKLFYEAHSLIFKG